jgi:glycosyl transferase family 25
LSGISSNYEFVVSNEKTDKAISDNLDQHYLFDKNILDRKMKLGEISVSVTHLRVYEDIIKNDYKLCLILEDDAILDQDFNDKLNRILSEQINEYDFIFLSSCCGLHVPKTNGNYIFKANTSRCACGYLVNNKKIKEVINNSIPISTTIDTHLNIIKGKLSLEYGWCEPTIITQGSENKYKSNLR